MLNTGERGQVLPLLLDIEPSRDILKGLQHVLLKFHLPLRKRQLSFKEKKKLSKDQRKGAWGDEELFPIRGAEE